MNSKDDRNLSDRYRRTPRVASPEQLDRRILQVARDETPAQPRSNAGRWAPLVATACMAGLALYVATPLLDQDALAPAPVLRDAAQPEAEVMLSAPDADVTTQLFESAPTVSGRQIRKSAMEEVDSKAESDTGSGLERMDSLSSDDESLGLVAEPAVSVPATAAKSSSIIANKPLETRAGESAEIKKQGDAATVSGSVPRKEASLEKQQSPEMVSKPPARLGPEEVERRLAEIQDLASRSLEQQAQRLLDELIRLCAECDLPATLAELRLNSDAVPE